MEHEIWIVKCENEYEIWNNEIWNNEMKHEIIMKLW